MNSTPSFDQQLTWLNQRREQEGLSMLDDSISSTELEKRYQQEQYLAQQLSALNITTSESTSQYSTLSSQTKRHSVWSFVSGFAACLALVAVLQFSPLLTEAPNNSVELAAVNQVIGYDDEIFIEVTLNSAQYIPMATINLSMNDNIQHQDYIGSDTVQWNEPLLPGSNTLILPLQLFNGNQLGLIDVSIESDDIEYNFNISTPSPELLQTI